MSTQPASLWTWARAAYELPGAADACLRLQDDHGQNVCLLLWAAWARTTDTHRMAAAAAVAHAWETAAVDKLRDARRSLKAQVPPVPDRAREALREQVRQAELRSERILLESLEAMTGLARGEASAAEALLAASNAWGRPAPAEDLDELATALDRGLLLLGAARPDRGGLAEFDAAADEDEEEWERSLRVRLASVTQDHADLDAAIQALAHAPLPDMLLIGRLKRKKLALKDEIGRIQEQLTPDIIA